MELRHLESRCPPNQSYEKLRIECDSAVLRLEFASAWSTMKLFYRSYLIGSGRPAYQAITVICRPRAPGAPHFDQLWISIPTRSAYIHFVHCARLIFHTFPDIHFHSNPTDHSTRCLRMPFLPDDGRSLEVRVLVAMRGRTLQLTCLAAAGCSHCKQRVSKLSVVILDLICWLHI